MGIGNPSRKTVVLFRSLLNHGLSSSCLARFDSYTPFSELFMYILGTVDQTIGR